jgi:hypothetical protein
MSNLMGVIGLLTRLGKLCRQLNIGAVARCDLEVI